MGFFCRFFRRASLTLSRGSPECTLIEYSSAEPSFNLKCKYLQLSSILSLHTCSNTKPLYQVQFLLICDYLGSRLNLVAAKDTRFK